MAWGVFLDERVRAKPRYVSEELQNCDGIAFGSATIIFLLGSGGGDIFFIKKLENNNCVFSYLS